MLKRLICKLVGHDWLPITNYASHNIRKCDRCGELGWDVPKR